MCSRKSSGWRWSGRELEATVRAYLDSGLRGEEAARTLHVHPNTVRNRLRRVEELTGADLRDPACLAELWWATEYDRIARGPARA